FAQASWDINDQWDITLGGRYERWESHDGYFTESAAPTTLVPVEENSSHQFSPKFSLGYAPTTDWLVRYSLARAYRFPIVEELFMKSQSYSSEIEAKPD